MSDDVLIDLADGISFQLRYLGSARIFRYRHYRFWITLPFSMLFVTSFAIMFVLHTMTLINCRNITDFTDLMYVFGIQINELVKIYDIISHKERIENMLDKLREDKIYPTEWSYRDELKRAVRHINITSFMLYVSAVGSAVMVFVSPFFKYHALPFICWFPMEVESDAGYWSAYSIEMCYVFYLSPLNITLDTFLTGLMHCVAFKLDVLNAEMKKLGNKQNCQENRDEINRVIVYHQDIMFMIDEIEEIFNSGIFIQSITCGSTLCIVGYRILISKLFSSDFIAMVMILTAFLGEIFYYCHFGNQIKVKAASLSEALYFSKWYNLECHCPATRSAEDGRQQIVHKSAMGRSLVIVMERMKRPISVTAGKLVQLTYETFIAICKGGFQAFAVLRDVQSK